MTTPRRNLAWITTESPLAALASNTGTNQLLYNTTIFGGMSTKGATLTRAIVDLTFRADSVSQLSEMYYGITVVNADARAAGAFPDPEDTTDRASWVVRGREYVISSSLSDQSQLVRVLRDIRSQRLLRSIEDELHLIMRNDGAFVCQWACYIRTLWKMPA